MPTRSTASLWAAAIATVLAVCAPRATAQTVTTTARTAPTTNRGLLTAATVPDLGLVDYAARPYDDKIGQGVAASCADATTVQQLSGSATDVGLGTTIGDASGRVVIRTQATRMRNAKSATRLVAALTSPGCAALAGGDVISGTVSQYPELPTLTWGTPAAADGEMTMPFTGTSSIGPLAGSLLVTPHRDTVGLAATRVSNPQAGEADKYSNGIHDAFEYETGVLARPLTRAQQAQITGASEIFDRILAAVSKHGALSDATRRATDRGAVRSYDAACQAQARAYDYSGERAALDGTTIQGNRDQFELHGEVMVFPSAGAARAYERISRDLPSDCVAKLWPAPSGAQLTRLTRTPKRGFSTSDRECDVSTSAVWSSPGSGKPASTRTLALERVDNVVVALDTQWTGDDTRKVGPQACAAAHRAVARAVD